MSFPALLAALLACAPDDPPPAAVADDTDAPAVDTDPPVDTDLPIDTDVFVDTDPPDTDPPPPTGPPTYADCFGAQWGATPPVDYSPYPATLGSHCGGTNHQDIQGIERVVFVGDSITVGTLPTPTGQWWRNRLADRLVRQFGLAAPSIGWRNANPIDGTTFEMFSGDFASCAKYGARTDDLLLDPHRQLETCIPEDQRDKVTLVVMSIGGNDIFSLLEDIGAGVDDETLRQTWRDANALLREAVEWVVTPGRFPNGAYVVFANTYDFTDLHGALDMAECDGAKLIGMDEPLLEPILWEIMAESQEEYLSIAVDTQTDLVFLGEAFCGHGWNTADPTSRCYRGPGTATWTDLTCEHPNGAGHDAIFDAMAAVIDE